MSLYGVMRTSVSGMGAQTTKLSTVADNIANSSTTGYKRASSEFASLILNNGTENYNSGGVNIRTRYMVNEQGNLSYTNSVTDLAIRGNGFMIVSDGNGTPYLTRAGSFVADGDGNLINAAGYRLMGYPYQNGSPAPVANGLTGLSTVNIKQTSLEATPSENGRFFANLPSQSDIVPAADLPSGNTAAAEFTKKTSLVAFDNLGNETVLDMYMTKSAANEWEMAVYAKADAASDGGFPYTTGPIATTTLTFDGTTGALDPASPDRLDIPVPNGATLDLDLGGMTQLASSYLVLDATVDGNAPSAIDRIEIAGDGTLFMLFENGSRVAAYKIPLADVPSPNNLTALPGNVYAASPDSGDVQVGFSTSGRLGTVVSGALESSTVDLAAELTEMIEAQRGYTANSKVFQTGSELLDVLVNLKR